MHGRREKTSLEQVAQEALSSDDKVADSTKLDMTVNPAKAKKGRGSVQVLQKKPLL